MSRIIPVLLTVYQGNGDAKLIYSLLLALIDRDIRLLGPGHHGHPPVFSKTIPSKTFSGSGVCSLIGHRDSCAIPNLLRTTGSCETCREDTYCCPQCYRYHKFLVYYGTSPPL